MEPFISDMHRAAQRAARDFCRREINPIARQIDQSAAFPWDVAERMAALGYFGMQVPPELGGAGLDTVGYVLMIEEISRASGGIGLCVTVHNSVAVYPLLAFGTPDQQTRWVPQLARGSRIGAFCLTEPNAGSDASAIESLAVLEGDTFRINANKVFVTNGGIADIALFFVRTLIAAGSSGHKDAGISVIVVERGTPGFMVGELEDLCGMRCNPVSSLRLTDCRVPRENLLGKVGQGLKIGLSALDTGRIGIAAQAVGIAQAALDEAVRYAKQRHQFKAPISRHQAVQMMIAEMATQVAAARLLVLKAATLRDQGEIFSEAAAMAKLFASEAAGRVTDMAVQIHGGYGFSKAYAVERYFRDARVTRIYEGTSEIHRMVIARSVMERADTL